MCCQIDTTSGVSPIIIRWPQRLLQQITISIIIKPTSQDLGLTPLAPRDCPEDKIIVFCEQIDIRGPVRNGGLYRQLPTSQPNNSQQSNALTICRSRRTSLHAQHHRTITYVLKYTYAACLPTGERYGAGRVTAHSGGSSDGMKSDEDESILGEGLALTNAMQHLSH